MTASLRAPLIVVKAQSTEKAAKQRREAGLLLRVGSDQVLPCLDAGRYPLIVSNSISSAKKRGTVAGRSGPEMSVPIMVKTASVVTDPLDGATCIKREGDQVW